VTLFLRLLRLGLLEGDLRNTRGVVERELDPRASTLDIPCGPGLLADLFAGGDYVGLDPRRSDVDAARTSRPGIFVCAEPSSIDVPDGRFAQVLARGLFDGLDDGGATRIVSELARVLRPGGRLLVMGTAPAPAYAILHRLALRTGEAGERRPGSALPSVLRPHFRVVSSFTYRSGFVRRLAVSARRAQSPAD
jgi:SAM-dependent methyltransferase